MRCQMEALIGELNRLKREGVTHVTVSEEALQGLRKVVAARSTARPSDAPDASEPVGTVGLPDNHVRAEVASSTLAQIFSSAATGARPVPRAVKAETSGRAIAGPPVLTLPDGDKRTRWTALREQVLNCPECRAHLRPGKQVVFGVGNLDASVFFCGEAPGAEEEIQGEPFVGPAGEILTKIIRAMGLQRSDVYIGNIMNWRPEMPTEHGNRPPTPEEMAFCLPYLKAQIEIVNPEVVVALGGTAARGLIGEADFVSLAKARGRLHTFEGRPFIITYHPSYLLRSPSLRTKRMVWEDMLQVMEQVGLPISEKQRGFFL